MKCAAVRKRLAAYLDGELDRRTGEILKTHLSLCSACSVAYDRMRNALGAARTWQARPLPEGFGEMVRGRAALGERARRVRFRPALRAGAVPRLVWEIGAGCLILVIGFVLGHLFWPGQVERGGCQGGVSERRVPERVEVEPLEDFVTHHRAKPESVHSRPVLREMLRWPEHLYKVVVGRPLQEERAYDERDVPLSGGGTEP